MRKNRFRIAVSFGLLIVVLGMYMLLFIQTDFVVYRPGSALSVTPMIHMDGGDQDDEGTFMLTTVSQITKVNWITYYYQSWFNRHAEIMDKRQIFRENENREEYFERQNYNMMSSQNRAVLAAYNKANIDYEVKVDQIIVIAVMDDMPAAQVLRSGDQLLAIDGVPLKDANQLSESIAAKNIGDTVNIQYRRNESEHEATIRLTNIAEAGSPQRAGIGITMGSVLSVVPDDPDKMVEFAVSNIGGPSAGFMFAMEIYNRLVPEDITMGWNIAGTGEIYADGTVGKIGGISHKIVAADRTQAELFFCPHENYEDAVKEAKKIGSPMKIVPVGNMDDAIQFLHEYANT